jgi:hypothetical protein
MSITKLQQYIQQIQNYEKLNFTECVRDDFNSVSTPKADMCDKTERK